MPFSLLKDVPALACGDPGTGILTAQRITVRQTPHEIRAT